MSTVHDFQQTLVIPKKLSIKSRTAAPKRSRRPQRTEISQLYESSSSKNLGENLSSKLEPIKNEDLLDQYNELVRPKESLAFKRLPPVKVSYQTAKHKFIESPRTESASQIICPHLSMKTYSPGHHIFTEGISKSSITRSPTFSLHHVGVPYSNLPDNISIYKEKDRFTFGVKSDEYEKSPYRLTPKQLKLGSATFIPALEADQEKSNIISNTSKKESRCSKSYFGKQLLEIRSNTIQLEPLATRNENETKYDFKNKPEFSTGIVQVPAGFTRPAKSPLAPSNSFYIQEPDVGAKSGTKNVEIEVKHAEKQKSKIEKSKRKVSVVSIGETVDPSFYENKKKEVRQLYPMYDHASKKNDDFKRQKFEYNERYIFKAKPHVPSSTFTYKVSTHGMAFLQDSHVDKFKPIRNNLYDRHGNVIHKQRGLGSYRLSESDEDISKKNSDYNFRRYYKRFFRRPKSSESQGTDFSQLPGNPPPSEISHIFSEDAHVLVNDVRNGMVTLVEERTMTAASLLSPKMDNAAIEDLREENRTSKESKLSNFEETDTCTDTDIQFENAIKSIERQQEQEIETVRNDSDKKSEPEFGLDSVRKVKERERSANENSSKGDGSVADQYIAEAEERIKHNSIAEETEHQMSNSTPTDFTFKPSKTTKFNEINEIQPNKQKSQSTVITNGYKQILAVPKLCLDSLDPNPSVQLTKERTSLSRSIQNMVVLEEKRRDNNARTGQNKSLSSEVTIGKENKVSLPVTRLRLYSDISTLSRQTSSISSNKENEDLYEVHANDSKPTDVCPKEKKVINNANIPFIYPSTSEVKAKRQ